MKFFALLLVWTLSLYAIISPSKIIETDALISDMIVNDGKIYTATDGKGINIFNIGSFKKLDAIHVPDILMGNNKSSSPKIYSVDHYKNSTVLVSESGNTFRDVYLIRDGITRKIIDNSQGLLIKKVRFIDLGHLLFGLSGDTIVLMDISKNTLLYQAQAGGGTFKDMVLSPSKSLVAVADEGGEITMINVKSGSKVKTLRGINVDSINHIDYKQNTIISAGQDRRVGIYRAKKSYFIETDFFVYAVGLSPSASRAVYTDGMDSELQVIDTASGAKVSRLQGGEVILDTLIFLDEHQLIGAGEDNKIYYWRIP